MGLITTPQLERQQNGAVDTVVKSRIVSQDDQAHSIYAEYEIVDQKWPSGEAKKTRRSEAQSVLTGQEISLSQTLHVEKPTLWDVKTDHIQLSIPCIRRFIRIRSWWMCQRRFGYRYLNWTEGGYSSMGGDRFHSVSLHHDHEALGAEENYKAEYRRLKQMDMRSMRRTTHSPTSEQTLKIAAELS